MPVSTSTSVRTLAWALGAALVLPACSGPGVPGAGGASDLDPTVRDTDDPTDPTEDVGTHLIGIVLDSMSQPLEGATITPPTGETAVSGVDGKFRIDDLQPAERALINVRKEGYARTQAPVAILENVENTLVQTLAKIDLIATFDADDGVSIDLGQGEASVILPAANFIDAAGAAYAGTVTAEVTWYELEEPGALGNELTAVPGDFSATRTDGSDVSLESFGMLQLNLIGDDGEDLELAGEAAPMRFPITDVGSVDLPQVGDTVPAWSYDEETGKWVEEGEGTVVAEDDGSLVWEFAAAHFSTWNVDRPLSTHGCVSGRLLDPFGNPREGVVARLIGISYIATTTARTAEDGTFCLEGKNDSTVFIEFQYSLGGDLATQRTDPITIPAGQGTCLGDFTDCVSVGDIPMEFNTCLMGVVVNRQNQPVSGVQVVSPAGGQAVTDADGGFCLTVPVFQQADTYVLPEVNSDVIYQPSRTFTQAGMPACQNGCPNIVLLRPYQETSCATGNVYTGSAAAPGFPVEVFDLGFPDQAVATATVSADGSFCATVPVTPDGVAVTAGPCGTKAFDSNWGGDTCDSSGNCLDAGDFNCPTN